MNETDDVTVVRLGGAPLNAIETLDYRCADGVIVVAVRRRDLIPGAFIFMGRHPARGLCFFRARRRHAPLTVGNGAAESEREAEVEVWEVTEAVRRCLQRRRERRDERAKAAVARRLQGAAGRHPKTEPKPGSPTPERRRHAAAEDAPIQRVVTPKPETATDAKMVYCAPDNLARLHRNGKITNNMLHAAARFHADWIAGGLDGLRPAAMVRVSRSTGGETHAAMAARDRVRKVCDRLGGHGSVGSQALIHVVAAGMMVAAWSETERAGRWRLDPNKAAGVLICALGVLEGFYRPRPETRESGA